MPSKTRPESDQDDKMPKRAKQEIDTVLNQDLELFSEEFPEGAYGSPQGAYQAVPNTNHQKQNRTHHKHAKHKG